MIDLSFAITYLRLNTCPGELLPITYQEKNSQEFLDGYAIFDQASTLQTALQDQF